MFTSFLQLKERQEKRSGFVPHGGRVGRGAGNWITDIQRRSERCSDRLFQPQCEQEKQRKKHKHKKHKQSARQRRKKRSLALSTRHSWSLARPRRRHRRRHTSEVTSVGGSSYLKSAFHFFSCPDICCQSATHASCCSAWAVTRQMRHPRRPLLVASPPTWPQLKQPIATTPG